MSERMISNLIHSAAGLLRGVSTYDEDYPHVPKYYKREVDQHQEKCRKAAILMREAADHIASLEAQLAEIKGLVVAGVVGKSTVTVCRKQYVCPQPIRRRTDARQFQAILDKYAK